MTAHPADGTTARETRPPLPALFELPKPPEPQPEPLRSTKPAPTPGAPAYGAYDGERARGYGPRRRRHRRLRAAGGVVLAGAAAAAALVFYLHPLGPHHTVSVPAGLDGMNSINVPGLALWETAVRPGFKNDGFSSVVFGYYGNSSVPGLVVVAAAGDSDRSSSGPAEVKRVTSLLTDRGVLSAEHTEMIDGRQFTCYALVVSGNPYGACVWVDGNVVGVLLDQKYDDLTAVAKVAAEARKAVEQ